MARLSARPFMGLLAITYQNLSLCQSKCELKSLIELQRGRRNLNDAWMFKLEMTHKEILLEIGRNKQKIAGETFGENHGKEEVLSIIDKTSLEPTYQQTEFCEPAPIVEVPEKHNT